MTDEQKKIYGLKDRLEHVTMQYAQRFAQKHGLPDFDGWVADRAGGVAYFGSIMVDFEDIRVDVDGKDGLQYPPVIWEGYHKMCEESSEDCCYHAYIMGYRTKDMHPWWHRLIIKVLKRYLTYYCQRLVRISDMLIVKTDGKY